MTAVCDNLNHLEPGLSAALLRETAPRLAQVVHALGAALPERLPGYPVRILDGYCRAAGEHRLAHL